ncbi:MAG: L,D-transpeptidase family protein [Methylococcales bacterium]|nr:L,D-transpeptidase family protein [Methylococcales bacterium]
MKVTVKIITGLALAGLLCACSRHKPVKATAGTTVIKPQARADRKTYYIPPPKLPGRWTVEDILQDYGTYVKGKLNYYFVKAKVAYPPREITFVALKQEKKLELWARDNGEFRFIRDYYIMAASGGAGPKLRQGDRQVPEGVYRIEGLNPNSHYHLSMKLNYPNEFDLLHAWQEGRDNPGSDIFIHGKAASIGCLAMGDDAIEELFVLTAQVGAENVKVVIAPHDPRVYPLKADSEELPAWTPELYSLISREVKVLSPVAKPVKTMNTGKINYDQTLSGVKPKTMRTGRINYGQASPATKSTKTGL